MNFIFQPIQYRRRIKKQLEELKNQKLKNKYIKFDG